MCLFVLGCSPLEPLSSYSQNAPSGASAPEAEADPGPGVDTGDAGPPSSPGDAASPPSLPSTSPEVDAGGSSAVRDTTPPQITATFPADGARGVLRDTELSITFDDAMDRESVEAAYTSDELPRQSVELGWSLDGRELRVTPLVPLAYAEGADLGLTARVYFVSFVDGATDAAGNALPASTFAFTTLRQITQRVGAIQDRNLTGNFRADGVYGSNGCEREQVRVCVGDSGVAPNIQSKGFVSFDLELPSEVTETVAARLELHVESVAGAPFTGLGALQVEPLSFSTIGAEAFAAPATGSTLTAATNASAGQDLAVDVLELFQSSSAPAPRQLRLRFASSTDLDTSVDMLLLSSQSPVLEVTYLIP